MLSTKANRPLLALNSRFKLKYLPVKIALKLFDSMIAPILLYGSEVWGPYLNFSQSDWDTNEIEKIHTQFLKRLLGVNRSTTNALVRGDLGRFPLNISVSCRTNNFIKHILHYSEPDSLVTQALEYERSVTDRKTIISFINELTDQLKTNGLTNSTLTALSKTATRKALESNYSIYWRTYIRNCSKALTYKSYKNQITYEKYLDLIPTRRHRRALSKLRLSDHCLAIEKGRHSKPPIGRNERFCRYCKNIVEDEIHFILVCSEYNFEREIFLNQIHSLYPNFKTIPSADQKFIYLMTNENKCFLEYFSAFEYDIYNKRTTLDK